MQSPYFLLLVLLLPVSGYAFKMELIVDATPNELALSVDYRFSDKVDEMSFESTPYGFVAREWTIESSSAQLEQSTLSVHFESPATELAIAVLRANDAFYQGFYTPFLNFSDNGKAVFIGHYLPDRVKVGGEWLDASDIDLTISINADADTSLRFSGHDRVRELSISPHSARQYAYVGNVVADESELVDVVLDPGLPVWIKQAYEDAIPALYGYYATQLQAELSVRPLFMVSFNPIDTKPRFDGGAINQQVLINFVGKGWADNPVEKRLDVLRLLAHEMAHLWNAQHWVAQGSDSVWLSEGGADFLARNALVALGHKSHERFLQHQTTQAQRCADALEREPLNGFTNRQNSYVCGEAIFYVLSQLINRPDDALVVMRKMMQHNGLPAYSKQDLLAVLEEAGIKRDALDAVKVLDQPQYAHEALVRLSELVLSASAAH